MNTRFLRAMALLCCVLCATSVMAQNPTGTVNGRVSYDNDALPGVTVSASSPSMQGTRTAITGGSGDYTFKFLPPGDYKVTFALDSFRTLEYDIKVSIAQTKTVDAVMYPEAVTEEIVVTSNYETISSGAEAATTYEQDLIEDLPILRNMDAAVLMTPGTTSTGPADNITIAGAQSHESLFLINGVVVNENLRGQALDLFIEDAIEETTTTVSGISAEYGRFAGGVVNMITKSGGNDFSGSYRLNLTNDDWEARTPLTTEQVDELNKVHEATLGGYLMKDRLWFFVAGRDRATDQSLQLDWGQPFTNSVEQRRYEAKLTFSPHASHRLLGSYIDVELDEVNRRRTGSIPAEFSALDRERSEPQKLLGLNYTGVITDSFFLEAQYSERNFSFVGSGGDAQPGDRINGTYLTNWYWNVAAGSYLFCGECGDEKRDNENYLAKGSYFLASDNFGTHDIVFGYDSYSDFRFSNNYQSPSNFKIYLYDEPLYDDNGTYYPVFEPGASEIDYWPMLIVSQGNDFTTNSAFVNDSWRVNDRLTVSAGVRYDENDGVDGKGEKVVDDSRISPRFGITYDLKGDGEWMLSATYGRYVTAIANNVAGGAGGGSPSWIGYQYEGPYINRDADGNLFTDYTTTEALQIVFDWFDSVGGLSNTDLWYSSPTLRGISNAIGDSLASPYGDEYAIGLTKRLGTKGLVRADYVHREYGDFYVSRRDMTTGQITWTGEVAPGAVVSEDFDFALTVNDPNDVLRREYDGLHTSFQYRLNDRLSFGGNWTWSHARGNFDGETSGSGPVTSTYLDYPEFQREEWTYPTGDLAIDQRHKVRAFAVWDAISSARHNLTLSLLQNFWTGQPYGAQGRVVVHPAYTSAEDPGYVSPPVWEYGYWFTNRDAFRTEDITRTDISLNYSFFSNLFGTEIELFVQPEILNLFNEHGVVDVDNAVTSYTLSFDPFTETPVEGEDWDRGADFGQPVEEGDFQLPRTFRVSVGIRF